MTALSKIRTNKEKGFIALFSVVIISFVLLLIAGTLNFMGFSSRLNILDSESKERSDELANACVESARLKIALDNTYIGFNNNIPVSAGICGYKVASGGLISAQACVNKAATFYIVNVDTTTPDIPILNFKEDASLSTCPLVAFF